MEKTPQTTGAARALLHTASALSNVHAHHAMTPEALLLSLLCDPAIRDAESPLVEEPELRRAILESDERGDDTGWAPRAKQVYTRAWQRASAREKSRPIGERMRSTFDTIASANRRVPVVLALRGTLSVGDVIHGLSGASPLVEDVLRRRALDPPRFDGEAPLPEVGYPAGLADDALVDVVALNDDVTRMDFVVDVLQRRFGCSPLQATYLMYRIHACGRARVSTCTRRVAEQRIDAAHEDARHLSFPLAFVYGPRL